MTRLEKITDFPGRMACEGRRGAGVLAVVGRVRVKFVGGMVNARALWAELRAPRDRVP